jgi:hypothetical protein
MSRGEPGCVPGQSKVHPPSLTASDQLRWTRSPKSNVQREEPVIRDLDPRIPGQSKVQGPKWKAGSGARGVRMIEDGYVHKAGMRATISSQPKA